MRSIAKRFRPPLPEQGQCIFIRWCGKAGQQRLHDRLQSAGRCHSLLSHALQHSLLLAVSSVETAKKAGFLPEELQKKYDQPITRREFCLLAATYYEHTTGMTISERSSFTDTQDLSVQKMGVWHRQRLWATADFHPQQADSSGSRHHPGTSVAALATRCPMDLPNMQTMI
jgi:hypothetical protein